MKHFAWVLIMLAIFSGWATASEDCATCHSDSELTGLDRKGQEISMFVDETKFKASSHGEFSCIDCHQDLAKVQDYPHADELQPVNCGLCHEDVAEEYAQSYHGLKFVNRENEAPGCADCHSSHNILSSSDSLSMTYFKNLTITCFECHQKNFEAKKDTLLVPTVNLDYLKGVHGKLVAADNDGAATCVSCHTAHSIRKKIDPQSSVFSMNIPTMCGECHVDQLALYSESIHSRALRHGVFESANCSNCHGEHQIMTPDDAYFIAANDACIKCHNDNKIIQKYGLQSNRVLTYMDSYHGLSTRLGREDAATCSGCHNGHDVQTAAEPFSSVHPDNLVKTCSKCHNNVSKSFATSYTHESMLIGTQGVNFYIKWIYITLIVVVIGGMLLHNLIIFLYYIRAKKAREQQLYIIRFKKLDVMQHLTLMASFIILVVTGFALRFPDSGWVQFFSYLGVTEVARGIIHRTAAVILILISLYHIYYIIFKPRGQREFLAILPKMRDIKEVFQAMAYYLGIKKEKPHYEEFDYTEKAEYWSVVWGTGVMALTGFILWFPTLVTQILPSWTVRASELIHYYEAILATLAILIFHLFFVIAHPEQYPMNLSWVTGRMSIKTAIAKHPEWIERVLRDGDPDAILPEVIRENCISMEDIKDFLNSGKTA